MNKKFSTKWKASKRPSKQRKYKANAPMHTKAKFVSVNLAKPLREKVGKRNVQIKKDDKVKVMRGKFKGTQGKVLSVSVKYAKVYVEGVQVTKMDNSKANVPLKPSNLQIIEMAERGKKKVAEKKKMQGTKSPTSSAEASSNETPKKEKSEDKNMEKKK
jgi:large subunit ribosomal protein L24